MTNPSMNNGNTHIKLAIDSLLSALIVASEYRANDKINKDLATPWLDKATKQIEHAKDELKG